MHFYPSPGLVRLLEERYHANREREYQALQAWRVALLQTLLTRRGPVLRRRLHKGGR